MYVSDNFEDVLQVWNSLSEEEKLMICNTEFDNSPYVKYRRVLIKDDIPVSFLELYVLPNYPNSAYVVVATNPNYRNKGYSKFLVRMAENDNIKTKKYSEFIWKTDSENKKSKCIAEKLGYKFTSKNNLQKFFLNF